MTRFAIAVAALTVAAGTAVAAEVPMPQVFRDTPFQKGQWKVEMLEMNANGVEHRGGMPGPMTVCMDDIREMGRGQGGQTDTSKRNCKVKLLKDTATEAIMEATCPDGTTRTTLTREGDKSYLMQATGTKRGENHSMKARYTFDSAQCAQSGVGIGAGMGRDKNSPECEKAKAQLATMNPGAMCANAGANRAMCEQNIQRMKSQLEAMCK